MIGLRHNTKTGLPVQHYLFTLLFAKTICMKKTFLLAFLLAEALFTFSQSTKVINDKNAQTRAVSAFHAIHVGGGIDLYLTQGSDEAVAVSATSTDVRDRIKTVVENGVLRIFLENKGMHWNWGNYKMKAYVSAKMLDALHASGGSDIYVQSDLNADNLELELSGGSDLKGKIVAKTVTVKQSGGSDVDISGSVGSLTVDASGGSDFSGYGLITDICSVVASGGSDIHITVNKELTADESGGSDIYYKGSGVIKEVKSSGSSSVYKKG